MTAVLRLGVTLSCATIYRTFSGSDYYDRSAKRSPLQPQMVYSCDEEQ